MIIGRAGAGKSARIYEEIRTAWEAGAQRPLILLVPEQYTLQAERELIAHMPVPGLLGIEVMSFRSLQQRILQESGGRTRVDIDAIGKNMLIQKILLEHGPELKLFYRCGYKDGFIRQLSMLLAEMKQGEIQPEQLEAAGLSAENHAVLGDKLHDISLLMTWFEEYMSGRYLDMEDRDRLVIERASDAGFLAGAEIWLDHFYHFTASRYRLLATMMRKVTRMSFAFTLDSSSPANVDLFQLPIATMYRLEQIAGELHLPVSRETIQRTNISKPPALRHLERTLFILPSTPYSEPVPALSLLAAQTVEEEVVSVARGILQKVQYEGLRFSDIAVIGFDLPTYESGIRRIFQEYGIPHFIDQKRSIMDTLLVKFVLGVLRLQAWYYRLPDVMELLKTGFLGIPTETVEDLENYAIAYGVEGFRWEREFYLGDPEKLAEREACRVRLVELLQNAFGGLREQTTYAGITQALYQGMEFLQIKEQLEEWIESLKAGEEREKAAEYAQVWDYVVQCFDQINEILADQTVTLAEYISVLEAGLSSVEVGLIPVTSDQVMVGTMQRSLLAPVAALYVIGLQGHVLPGMLAADSLLTPEEQEELRGRGVELGISQDLRLAEEYYLAYESLSRPTQSLHFSYALSDSEGKTNTPSLFIHQLKGTFPTLTTSTNLHKNSVEKLDRVVSPSSGLGFLLEELRLFAEGDEIDQVWWEVLGWYYHQPEWWEQTALALQGLSRHNQIPPLPMNQLAGLYGTPLKSSVARLEAFSLCPFAHFIQYGLQPVPRREFVLQAPDLGSYLHRALQQYGRTVSAHHLDWKTLDRDTCKAIIQELALTLPEEYEQAVFNSSFRNQFLYEKLGRIAEASAWALTRQIAEGSFKPWAYEVAFGQQGKLPALNLPLSSGGSLVLEGRIDRIDAARIDGTDYLRVVDYKSRSQELSFSNVYYGFDLQLLLYMLVAVKNWKNPKVQPAGAFYFPMDDPWIDLSRVGEKTLENEWMRRFRLQGVLADTPGVIVGMDEKLKAETGESVIVPLRLSKTGDISRQASVLSAGDFKALLDYSAQYMKSVGEKISQGEARIEPVRSEGIHACEYCEYHAICEFDPELLGHRYRYLPPLKKAEVLEKIRGKGGKEA